MRAWLAVALLAGATAARAEPPPELKAGVSIEREIAGGEQHTYALALEAGTFVIVEAFQKGVDLALSAQDPAGLSLGEVNFQQRGDGSEAISLIAEKTGVHRIRVRPGFSDAPGGGYELRVRELREASAKDRFRVQAERIREEGVRLWRQRTAESMEKALPLLGEARRLYRTTGHKPWSGGACWATWGHHWELGHQAEALAHYEQSLPLRRAGGTPAGAMTLSNMGLVYSSTGSFGRRSRLPERADPVARLGFRSGEGLTLHQLDTPRFRLGEYQAALETLRQAIVVSRAARDRAIEAVVLAALGRLYLHLGEEETAFRHLAQARALFATIGDGRGEARTLLYLVEPIAGRAACGGVGSG